MDSVKAANYSNIGTFLLTVIILIFMVRADPRPSTVTAWIMPSLLALAVLGAGVLHFAASRHKTAPDLSEDGTDETDYQQLFLDSQISSEKYQYESVLCREERNQLRNEVDQLKAQKPDTSIKDYDPKIEIKIADLRGKTILKQPHEQACFDLINRGKQSPAIFFCIEDFQVGGYRVAFRSFPSAIAPFGNHDSIYPLYINNPDGSLCDLDIFTVFFHAWDALNNRKLYEYPVAIKATYQDEARNLFEIRCDLVFYPQEHIDHQTGGSGTPIIEAKNQKIRKVSTVTTPINWSV